MSPRLLRAVLFLGGVLLLFPLQAVGDAHRPELPSSLLYAPDRRLMKVIACGHGSTIADLVWVQSTNYVMSEFKSGKTHIEHLYALYDVMTELDPDFVDAYVTGAVFLSSVADEPDLSLKLLEKGHGRLEERQVDTKSSIAQVTSGHVDDANKERWKLLGEIAATHLVSLAGFAPTLEERYVEVNLGGRLYLWGAKRYPIDRYPERPPYWEEIGKTLAGRDARTSGSRAGWYYAVRQVWEQRLHFTAPGSPLYDLYLRRRNEIVARQIFEDLEAGFEHWKAAHRGEPPRTLQEFLVKIPDDPLGVGFYIVDGKLVAPALDAAFIERQLARQRKDEPEPVIPRWVHVTRDPLTGTPHCQGVPPS